MGIFKTFCKEVRPLEVNDYLGVHQKRPLARVGAIHMANQFIGMGLHMVSVVILSRLLPPETFGLIAMVTFFRGMMDMVSTSGFVEAAIQKKDLSLQDINNLFWTNTASSIILATIFALCAPIISAFYGEPSLKNICYVIAGLYILENVFRAHDGLLKRTLRVETSLWINIIASITSTLTSVCLAVMGYEVWALVGGMVCSAIIRRGMFSYYVRWMPGRFAFSSGFGEMTKYGLQAMMGSIVGYLSRYSQNLALGKYATPTDVGYYSRGGALFFMPISKIIQPIAQIMLPVLSRHKDEREELMEIMLRATWLVSIIVLPFVVFTSVFGKELVLLLLGDKWKPSGDVTVWLAISSVFCIPTCMLSRGNSAIGRPARGALILLVSLPVLIIGVAYYAPSGAIAVAKFYALYRIIQLPLLIWYNLKGSNFPSYKYLRNYFEILFLGVVSGMISYLLKIYMLNHVNSIVLITSGMVIAYILFTSGSYLFDNGKFVLKWMMLKVRKV